MVVSLRTYAALLIVFLAIFQVFPAYGTTRAVPGSQQEVMLSYAPLVKKAAPAVVNIYTSRKVQVRTSPFLSDPFFGDLFGESFSFGRTREKVVNSLGSGVIIDPEGLIITNLHVVRDGGEIKVVLADNRELDAKVVLEDSRTDLALLKIDVKGKRLSYLEFADGNSLQVGDIVLAIGNPFGVGQTVTNGIVSALARTAVGITDYEFFIQTDAAINPGNSGGALVDMQGKLAGINTAIFSKSGGSHGVGFATPVTMAKVILRNYQRGSNRVIRPWLGAATQNITTDIAESMELEKPTGVLIKKIFPESAADKAGLEVGDIIIAVEDKEIINQESLKFLIATYPLGEKVEFTLLQRGKVKKLSVVMELPAENVPRNTTLLEGEQPLAGAIVENLSPALADELGINKYQGVIITDIQLRSPARRIFKKGDIILSVNGHSVDSVERLQELVEESRKSWKISAQRGGQVISISISH